MILMIIVKSSSNTCDSSSVTIESPETAVFIENVLRRFDGRLGVDDTDTTMTV